MQEVYEQQKELILLGERVVLATLGFDLNVHHPYKPLVEAIKKFKVAQNALAQVAWNFVNDGYDPMFFLLSFNNYSSMVSLPSLGLLHTMESGLQTENIALPAI
jgi:hypothetical protein